LILKLQPTTVRTVEANQTDLHSLVAEEAPSAFHSQLVITTHSPHILYERGFAPIRYFRRHFAAGQQTTTILNLSSFQTGAHPKDRDFLQRYRRVVKSWLWLFHPVDSGGKIGPSSGRQDFSKP